MLKKPTKVMACVKFSKGKDSVEKVVAVHGVEGKSPLEDNFSNSERYQSCVWKNYEDP